MKDADKPVPSSLCLCYTGVIRKKPGPCHDFTDWQRPDDTQPSGRDWGNKSQAVAVR